MRLIVLLLLSSSAWAKCETFDEAYYEHDSAVREGKPFNDRAETSLDMAWLNIFNCRYGRVFVRGALGMNVTNQSEFEGRAPFGRVQIGVKLKK